MRLGMYVWKIAAVPPPPVLAQLCSDYGITDLCVKVAEGTQAYNQVDAAGRWIGNDSYLKDWWMQLTSAGLRMHGWHFIYPNPVISPGAQAGRAGERWQKLPMQSYKIDAEHIVNAYINCPWETSAYRKASAITFMDQIRGSGIPLTASVGLASYRFPTLHAPFPFKQFVNHPGSDHINPQVYWALANNPAEQLSRCIAEYNVIHPISKDFPIEPIGIMAGESYSGKYWEPTTSHIREFSEAASDLGAACPILWYYSLDYVWAKQRLDWLEAAGFMQTPPPPPPPPPVPEPGSNVFTMQVLETTTPYLNVRGGPGASYPDVGDLKPGEVFRATDIEGTDAWVRIVDGPYIGNWVCVKSGTRAYCDMIYA